MKTSSSRLQTNKKTKNLSGKGSSSVTQKKKNKRPSPVAATTDIEAILSECQNALKGELSVVTTTTPTTPKLCEEVESSNQNAPDEARLVRSPRKKIRQNASSPKDILHSRVAKYFDKELYFGDIVRRKDDSGWYEVSYDDGDAEEWDFAEAEQGMQLCHKNASNKESNLWEIYHIDAKQLKKEWAATASTKKKGFLLPTAMVQHCPTVAKFFLFLLERQRAWLRRKHHNKEHPELWTNDPVFRNYYFCNVYRQLDRGTAYFRAHVLKLWSDHVKEGAAAAAAVSRPKWLVQVLWASYCYRLINKIESFQSDPDCTDPNPTTTMGGIPSMDRWPQFRKLVQQAKEENKVVFTNAHQTCGFDRYIEQLDQVHKEPQKLEAVAAKSCQGLEACFRAIRSELPGCGQFMAWQILCDLTEANCLPKELPDADFCVLGNGAEAGIQEIFFPGVAKPSLNKKEYLAFTKMLVEHQGDVYSRLKPEGFSIHFPYWQGQLLTTKEIEHALCEFSKYQRIERALKDKARTGQRLRKSRAQLDQKHATHHKCGACAAATSQLLVLCDTCNLGYCSKCDATKRNADEWVCKLCNALNNHSWK